jgi:hypothetical protein
MKNQPDEPKSGDKKPWKPENFVPAFTAVLTRSGYDRAFRESLTASPESAKQAVSKEGNIEIPPEIVIAFHEHVSNDNYHVLHLPVLDAKQKKTYEYEEHLDCCYNRFLIGRDNKFQNLTVSPRATKQPGQSGPTEKKKWNPDNAATAFTAALTRSGWDKPFRERLIKSSNEAKKAVAEEDNIEIPPEVVILFHDGKYNDNYHVFYLSDFKEGEPHETHEYRDHFQAAYHVW